MNPYVDTETGTSDYQAFFLVGPTAVGKTAVAHSLACRTGAVILSADALLVYQDMNIGTAKPTPQEQDEVEYFGMDIVSPAAPFSTGTYLEYVRRIMPGIKCAKKPVIVAGGTGLYINSLLQGLDSQVPADAVLRASCETLYQQGGLKALQDKLKKTSSVWYEYVDDKQNHRRLIRALEMARAGVAVPVERDLSASPRLVGLRMEKPQLNSRIRLRVEKMYSNGLLDEVGQLMKKYGSLSPTAGKAIGYSEAAGVLEGTMKIDEAKERTVIRTRQLAKRQMTWFRHKANVCWLEIDLSMSVAETAEMVRNKWDELGSAALHI